MMTLWSSAERGFSTNGLWNTCPFTSIVSLVVSVSSSVRGAEGSGYHSLFITGVSIWRYGTENSAKKTFPAPEINSSMIDSREDLLR